MRAGGGKAAAPSLLPTQTMLAIEELVGTEQCPIKAPGERNANRQPGPPRGNGGGFGPIGWRDGLCGSEIGLLVCQRPLGGQIGLTHEPLGGERPYHQIADEADHEHAHKDVHGLVINLLARHTEAELVLTHVIDHDRPQYPGGGPGSE